MSALPAGISRGKNRMLSPCVKIRKYFPRTAFDCALSGPLWRPDHRPALTCPGLSVGSMPPLLPLQRFKVIPI